MTLGNTDRNWYRRNNHWRFGCLDTISISISPNPSRQRERSIPIAGPLALKAPRKPSGCQGDRLRLGWRWQQAGIFRRNCYGTGKRDGGRSKENEIDRRASKADQNQLLHGLFAHAIPFLLCNRVKSRHGNAFKIGSSGRNGEFQTHCIASRADNVQTGNRNLSACPNNKRPHIR